MRLLLLTQTVNPNDPILGFFHRWIEEFAKNTTSVTVLALSVYEHTLPDNVEVLSLGKEHGIGKWGRLKNFYHVVWSKRKEYDAVFVHMNPEYVVLAGFLWKLLKKKVVLWYTHKSVDMKLRIATMFSDVVCTASKESFRIKSKKVFVTGHGIDTSLFVFNPHESNTLLKLVTVGRISQTKNLHVLIRAVEHLVKEKKVSAHLTIVGSPITPHDKKYFESLKALVNKCSLTEEVAFAGSKSQSELANLLPGMDMMLHASDTGSLDKVVLEAMSVGVIPITSNTACVHALGEYADALSFVRGNHAMLADVVHAVSGINKPGVQKYLRDKVESEHGLTNLIKKIVGKYNG